MIRSMSASISLATTLLCASFAHADYSAVADDGREILLKENGHWEYRNNDRFATTEDGTRVRIKADGSWQFLGNAPTITTDQVRTEHLDIQLQEVITEEYKSATAKSSHYSSQTVFHLAVKVSNYGETINAQLDSFEHFNVVDDRGEKYPIIAISPSEVNWAPGSENVIRIRVDGSPKGSIRLGIKKISLAIDKAVFDHSSDLRFTWRTDEIKFKKVKRFK